MGDGLLPKSAHPEALTEDKVSEPVGPIDALSSAVKLANLFKLPIVIVRIATISGKRNGANFLGAG